MAAEEEIKEINDHPKEEIRPLTANELVTPAKSRVDWLDDLQGVSQSDETDSNMPILERYQKHLKNTVGILGAISQLKRKQTPSSLGASSESSYFKSDKPPKDDESDFL